MKLTRQMILMFSIVDTAIMGALWFLVIPGFMGDTLKDPAVRVFYYYGMPVFWIGMQALLVSKIKPKNEG